MNENLNKTQEIVLLDSASYDLKSLNIIVYLFAINTQSLIRTDLKLLTPGNC